MNEKYILISLTHLLMTDLPLCVLADCARPPHVCAVLLLHDHLAHCPGLDQFANLGSYMILDISGFSKLPN